MSGICIVGGARDTERRARKLAARMARRSQLSAVLAAGPDIAVGRAWHGRLAAGHCMSADADGLLVLIDGELYGEDRPLEDPVSVIRALYRAGRLDEICRLNGEFVVIIADPQAGRVVLASDRLGTRPLYVWADGRRFAAASRLGALLDDDRVPRRLSVQGVVELMSYARTVVDHTQYADVFCLPGSEIVVLEDGGMTRRQAWVLNWRSPDFDEHEGAELLAAALTAAVRRRLGDGARAALLLSGGLDSRLLLAAGGELWTECVTAIAHENREVGIARRCAATAGRPFRTVDAAPHLLSGYLDEAVAESDGLYAPPLNMFGALTEIVGANQVLLSGHGIDYTLRGMYLPKRSVRGRSGSTSLPRLAPNLDGAPQTVADNQLVSVPEASLRWAVRPEFWREWQARRVDAMACAIGRAEVENPYDAWDAYILGNQARHYTCGEFLAMGAVVDYRHVPFDPEVFDLYLSMPPEWRVSGRMVRRAAKLLSPRLMALPNGNTGFRADLPLFATGALVVGRGALRRLGMFALTDPPDPVMTHYSWPNHAEWLRRDPALAERVRALPKSPELRDTGLFSTDGLKTLVENHLERRENHAKFLFVALALSSWLQRHPYSAVH